MEESSGQVPLPMGGYVAMTTMAMFSNMTDAPAPTLAAWVIIFDNVQLGCAFLGIIANTLTLITLTMNGDGFSEIIGILLKYQSALDAIVSLFGFLLFVAPPFWSVGNYTVDQLICHLWHSTFLYWFSISVSIWNLVLLAVERYICICHPLKYLAITKSKIRLMIVGCFLLALFGSFGAVFNSRMGVDKCESGFISETDAFNKFMAYFAISVFFTFYAVPTVLFIILYGMIINQFRQRAKTALGASGSSAVIDKASSELTKTAIVVTIIFIIAYTWDLWYYLLGYVGVTEYVVNSPLMKIGIFLAVINSVVNPFVYVSLMPVYRRSIQKTFLSCTLKK